MCGGHSYVIAAAMPDDMPQDNIPSEQKVLIRKVFKGEIPGIIDIPSTLQSAKVFMTGVLEGYAESLGIKVEKLITSISYDTPHWHMLANLEKNVYQFSSAKNYQQLSALTDALKDGDRLRSYREFSREAGQILNEFNKVYLKPEYNTAINGALNAGNWVTYQENKDLMPNLKYVTAGDNRVREEHRLLDGTIRPVDDAWWDTHYPPLAFNCRCTTYQLATQGKVTPIKDIPFVEVPKMFQVNLAKENLVFPEGSAYYNGIPRNLPKKANALYEENKVIKKQ